MADSIRELNTGSKDAVRYMVREITHICKDMKSREPGSEGEREAAGYMADVLRETCGCTDVKVETFEEHPSSFYGYFYIFLGICFDAFGNNTCISQFLTVIPLRL